MAQPFAIRDVRIFDGTTVLPCGTVVVQDGTITSVGEVVVIPADATVVDGTGHTLLPGLIDAHTHTFGSALRQALAFGVTTELDMFTHPRQAAGLEQQAAADGSAIADLRSAGFLATPLGGHGTQFGLDVPTLDRPEEVSAWVDARISEGSDYIKIIVEDGPSAGRRFVRLDWETIDALIACAHRCGKLAVAHVSKREDARRAIELGVDGLAHVFADEPPDRDLLRLAVEHDVFIVATLAVREGWSNAHAGPALAADPCLAPYLAGADIAALVDVRPPTSAARARPAVAAEAVRRLHAAGVRILAGTDAPNPGTVHGVSLHRELELLVHAGLRPVEALTAATSRTAQAFGLSDRGRIAPGLRADLMLVEGDPTADITMTRAIAGVWQRGFRLDRDAYRASITRP